MWSNYVTVSLETARAADTEIKRHEGMICRNEIVIVQIKPNKVAY